MRIYFKVNNPHKGVKMVAKQSRPRQIADGPVGLSLKEFEQHQERLSLQYPISEMVAHKRLFQSSSNFQQSSN